MAEKINIQELISLLVTKDSVEKDIADKFVREFFALIEEGLQKDRYVKIKGFGVFKLVDVESRESINVNTGERIEIQGHTKVSFIPDTTLKDIINKPFAHFETVILGENVDFNDEKIEDNENTSLDESNTEEEDIILIEAPEIEEQIEIEEEESIPVPENIIPEDIIQETAVPENVIIETVVPEEIEEEIHEEEVPEDELMPFPEEDEEENIVYETNVDEPVIDDEIDDTQEILEKNETEDIIEQEPVISPVQLSDNPSDDISPLNTQIKEKKKKNIPRIIFEVILILLVLLFLFLFLYYQDKEKLFGDIKDVFPPFIENIFGIEDDPIHTPISVSDTISVVDITEVEPEQIEEIPEPEIEEIKPEVKPVRRADRIVKTPTVPPVYDPYVPVYADSTRYNIVGTKAHHKLQQGETLVQISLRYYGTKDLYPYLIKHNKKKITNPNSIPIGTIIDIPDLELK